MAAYQTQGGAWDRGPNAQRRSKSAAWAAGAALAAVGGQASAAVIVVDSLADDLTAGDNLCTLREAVGNANSNTDNTGGDCAAGAGADTIDLSGLTGTITLGGAHLALTDSVTLQGPTVGTLTIDANNASRIFYSFGGGAARNVTISHLTLTRGNAVGLGGGAIYFASAGSLSIQNSTLTGNTTTTKGGAVFSNNNAGAITVSNSSITNNVASSRGGGLFLYNTNSASTISNSTISGNTSGNRGAGISLYKLNAPLGISNTTISGNTAGVGQRGGGLFLYRSSTPGTLTIARSTISGNTAGGFGGGLFLYRTNSALLLDNTTVSGNTASTNRGGGIYMRGPFGASHSLNIRSSTIASNTASASGGNIDAGSGAHTINIANSIVAGGAAPAGPDIRSGSATINLNYSLLENTTDAAVVGANNVIGVSPQLAGLANNGGATQTRLIANTSPARDTGSTVFVAVAATDQRGLTRTVGSSIDMGAVEIQLAVAPISTASAIPTLSQWALALMATLLAWVGIRRYPKV